MAPIRGRARTTVSAPPTAPLPRGPRRPRLLWDALLDGFTAFWKGNAEWMLRRQPYSEAAAQLVFMAWLHRIVNGGAEIQAHPAGVAAIDREYAVGSGRIDILVRWPLPAGGVERFAAELKVRRDGDGDPREDGLDQLGEYLDRLGLDTGTLVLFDQRTNAPPIKERCSRSETGSEQSRRRGWRAPIRRSARCSGSKPAGSLHGLFGDAARPLLCYS